jgi:hypothetical protein
MIGFTNPLKRNCLRPLLRRHFTASHGPELAFAGGRSWPAVA